jgi:beta-N-acetylhexosaminidase
VLIATVMATAATLGAGGPPATAELPRGRSLGGRTIAVERKGDPGADRRVIVVGSIHGDEPGVDLNRNVPHRWRRTGRGRYFGGRRPGSEPEIRYAMRLTRAVRPDVTVWLHQPYGIVVPAARARLGLVRRSAKLPVRRLPRHRGTAAGWQGTELGNGGAFVVELAAGTPSRRTVRRHVRAILGVARRGAMSASAYQAQAPAPTEKQPATAAPKPTIDWDPIPFGAGRRAQTRRYARRHYGLRTMLLEEPKTIVEHFTVTRSYRATWSTFASNAADLGEKPGTCAHFVVDRDGTIHQLVRLRNMCRHAVGLNHVAIGIEHVGSSDGEVMGDRRQLRASLRLTRWLQERYAIRTRYVIGHAESLSSPFHRERVAAWRRQTHGDFRRSTMKRYRARLAARAGR